MANYIQLLSYETLLVSRSHKMQDANCFEKILILLVRIRFKV